MDATHNDEYFLDICKKKINLKVFKSVEKDLKHPDFERLSEAIFKQTGVQISVSTLKRVWGKLEYDGFPSLTTLNAFSVFLEFEDWWDFKEKHNSKKSLILDALHHKSAMIAIVVIAIIALVAGLRYGYIHYYVDYASNKRNTDILQNKRYVFEARNAKGQSPLTVFFDYDFKAFGDKDTLFITTHDRTKKSRFILSKEDSVTSAIYYKPFPTYAYLWLNSQVIDSIRINIVSNGWVAFTNLSNNALFTEKNILHQGAMNFDGYIKDQKNSEIEQVRVNKKLRATYVYSKDFSLNGDDFVLETMAKMNDTTDDNDCSIFIFNVTCEKGFVEFSISKKGCEVQNNIYIGDKYFSGRKMDFSALGVDISKWQKASIKSVNNRVAFYLNDAEAFSNTLENELGRISFIKFASSGVGSVDYIKLSDNNGNIALDDNFER